jgi:hypothetical protein
VAVVPPQASPPAAPCEITEEQVAGTLEKVAENRSPPDDERLRAQADQARRHAAKERDLSTRYNIRGGHDGRSDDAGQ